MIAYLLLQQTQSQFNETISSHWNSFIALGLIVVVIIVGWWLMNGGKGKS